MRFARFLTETSIHGFNDVASAERRLGVLWVFALVGTWIYALVSSAGILVEYMGEPTNMIASSITNAGLKHIMYCPDSWVNLFFSIFLCLSPYIVF